jgi:hypothetical protein
MCKIGSKMPCTSKRGTAYCIYVAVNANLNFLDTRNISFWAF